MVYRLYGVPDYANFAVHCALAELGQPMETVFLDVAAGDLKSPDHLARQPLGLVPALDTPEGTIFETAGLLLWLADRHGGGLAPAPSDPDRGLFLSWFVFANNSVHPVVLDLLHPHRAAGEACARAVAETAHARLHDRFALLDRVAAARPRWLSPENPGILGIYLSMLLRWTHTAAAYPDHSIPARGFPALHAIAAACETRPAILRVAAEHGLAGRFLTEPEC